MGNTGLRRRRPAFAAGLATLALALGVTAAPAQAAPPPQADYVALGDSYAAGQGAEPYLDLSCFVSRRGYPAVADQLRNVELTVNAGCSGDQIPQVVEAAVAAVDGGTEVVTITVGANDIGAVPVLVSCLPDPAGLACAAALGTARTALGDGSLLTSLQDMVGRIHSESPDAKIVLTGYPRLFDSTHPFAVVANPLADALNQTIALAARNSGAHFVDVAAAFEHHGIGSAEPWINFNPANPLDPANFHPNGEGYRHGYFASLVEQNAFTLS